MKSKTTSYCSTSCICLWFVNFTTWDCQKSLILYREKAIDHLVHLWSFDQHNFRIYIYFALSWLCSCRGRSWYILNWCLNLTCPVITNQFRANGEGHKGQVLHDYNLITLSKRIECMYSPTHRVYPFKKNTECTVHLHCCTAS